MRPDDEPAPAAPPKPGKLPPLASLLKRTHLSRADGSARFGRLGDGVGVSDACVDVLCRAARVAPLRCLELRQSAVTDEGVRLLADRFAATLRNLDLSHCDGLTDACVDHLAALTNLCTLRLKLSKACAITDVGVTSLLRRLRRCELTVTSTRGRGDAVALPPPEILAALAIRSVTETSSHVGRWPPALLPGEGGLWAVTVKKDTD